MTMYKYNKKGRVGGETDTAFLKDDKKGSPQVSLKKERTSSSPNFPPLVLNIP